jgi:hypothetical protein
MSDLEELRTAGHAPMPPDGGALRIEYRASDVIALGNRRYDEGWNAALRAALSGSTAPLDIERLATALYDVSAELDEWPALSVEHAQALAARLASPDPTQ